MSAATPSIFSSLPAGPRAQARSRILFGLGVAAVLLAVALPVLLHLYLPLVDLPNHIARLHIAAAGGEGALSQYYSYQLKIVPNTAADLLWALAGMPGDPARFAQLLMAFYLASFVLSVMVLARMLQGRWTFWSLAAALFAYNSAFLWGFQNFVLSSPFALLALGLWLRTEEMGTARRALLFLPVALILYLMHFFAFSFLCIGILGREVQLLFAARGAGRGRQLRRSLVLALPFLVPVFWLIGEILLSPPSPAGSDLAFGSLLKRINIIYSLALLPGSGMLEPLNITGMAVVLVTLPCILLMFRKTGPRLQVLPELRGPAVALALAAVLTPHILNGVAMVDIRIPFLLVALLIAGSRWQGLSAGGARAIVMIFALLLLARGLAFERAAAAHDAEVRELTGMLEALPEGARLIPMRAPGYEDDTARWHLDAYSVVTRNAFSPLLFQGVHALVVKEPWTRMSHAAGIPADALRLANEIDPRVGAVRHLRNWQQNFTHALLLDPAAEPLPIAGQLEEIAAGGRFTLYRILPGSAGEGG